MWLLASGHHTGQLGARRSDKNAEATLTVTKLSAWQKGPGPSNGRP